MNKASFIGRLTADPELRYTQNGIACVNFRMAVQRNFKNKDGEYEADFISFVAWRKPAEVIANYVRKGQQLGVVGRLQTGTYEDSQGNRRNTFEIIVEEFTFVGSRNGESTEQVNTPEEGMPLYEVSPEDIPW